MYSEDRGRTLARFWKRVNKQGQSPGACWLWVGHKCEDGYGVFHETVRGLWRRRRAHRYAYELLVAPIGAGLTIDHLCRVRNCVNPAHLEPVTIRENALRGNTRAAFNAAKTHCVRGHEFTPENIYRSPAKPMARVCRSCLRSTRRAGRVVVAIPPPSEG